MNKDPISLVVCEPPFSELVPIEFFVGFASDDFRNVIEMSPAVETINHVFFVALPWHPREQRGENQLSNKDADFLKRYCASSTT